VYLAENITPLVHPGQHIRKGQAIARAHGTFPFLEYGWAADAQGTTLSKAHNTYNHAGDPGARPTPEGKSFLHFLGF
jgi:hypothetical protein